MKKKERLVLDLLSSERGGLFGLELVERSDGALRRGAIYATMFALEEKGLVVWTLSQEDPPRRIYELTEKGRAS